VARLSLPARPIVQSLSVRNFQVGTSGDLTLTGTNLGSVNVVDLVKDNTVVASYVLDDCLGDVGRVELAPVSRRRYLLRRGRRTGGAFSAQWRHHDDGHPSAAGFDLVSPTSGPTAGRHGGHSLRSGTVDRDTDSSGPCPASSPTLPPASCVTCKYVTVVAPKALASGTVDIRVITPVGESSVSSADRFTYLVPPRPQLSSLSPSVASNQSTTLVTLRGTNFDQVVRVTIGTLNYPRATWLSGTKTQITLRVAPHALGTVAVTVSSSESSSTPLTLTYESTPAVASVTSPTVPHGRTTTVTVHGSSLAGALAVHAGSVALTISTRRRTPSRW
jgi:hypothetical protein